MLQSNYNDPQTYRRTLMIYGGEAKEGFTHQIKKICQRYFRQTNNESPPDAALVHFATILWRLIEKNGLPPALEPSDQGQDAALSEADLSSKLDELWSAFRFVDHRAALEAPARHLIKGIWQPEFKKCRLSYKEESSAGKCDRQNLTKSLGRISGAHCVDCPYWVSISAEKNEKLLKKEWDQNSVVELSANMDVFLPEDYRSLRQLLYMHARFAPAN
ncbi:MAG: hypothetical protein SynsKO_36120 [Synoicihabitans sp.]